MSQVSSHAVCGKDSHTWLCSLYDSQWQVSSGFAPFQCLVLTGTEEPLQQHSGPSISKQISSNFCLLHFRVYLHEGFRI